MFSMLFGKKKAESPASQGHTAQTAVSEVVRTRHTHVACDGPSFSKHPRVYLGMTDEGKVVCPYCSRQFVYDAAARD